MLSLPPVTRAIILINVIAFIAQGMSGDSQFIASLALWPIGASSNLPFMPWQLVTYSFLHAGLAHIAFNMFALFMFGGEIERLFGARLFTVYYFVCVIAAGVTQLTVAALSSGPAYPTIGASGGVFGLLLAFGVYFPRRKVMLLFPPIPMPAWVFVTGYGIVELYLGVTGTQAGVAHFAHLGGMLGGILLIAQRHIRRTRRR